MITTINEFKTIYGFDNNMPSVEQLYEMFTDINNEELANDGEDSAYVPLSAVAYYAEQIENIYGVSKEDAKYLAAELSKYAESKNA